MTERPQTIPLLRLIPVESRVAVRTLFRTWHAALAADQRFSSLRKAAVTEAAEAANASIIPLCTIRRARRRTATSASPTGASRAAAATRAGRSSRLARDLETTAATTRPAISMVPGW